MGEKRRRNAALKEIDAERTTSKSTQKKLNDEQSNHKATKINLDKLQGEFDAEKQSHAIVKDELTQERAKVVARINDLAVEMEQHNATKRELETAKLPFWKKLGM